MAQNKQVELTMNEVVARNMREARRERGWTLDETGKRLEESTGKRWSKATLSAAERSTGGRVRRFDADDLLALVVVFGMPLSRFMSPPAGTRLVREKGTMPSSGAFARAQMFPEREQLYATLPAALRDAADLLEKEMSVDAQRMSVEDHLRSIQRGGQR
jgi:transcriptional regulator with XRE-family HTH domain